MPDVKRRGLMLVLSSPSGAGKTTIARRLLEGDDNLELSISYTTRRKRLGERKGYDYRFVGADRFARMVEASELLEHATVFGNSYGTPREPVENALDAGRDMLFDVDWQGAGQLRKAMERDVVSVFILPPSAEELRRRLVDRGSDELHVVRNRMARAGDEMRHWEDYDYVIVNDDVEESVTSLRVVLAAERLRRDRDTTGATGGSEAMLAAEHLRRDRQPGMPEFVARLREELDGS